MNTGPTKRRIWPAEVSVTQEERKVLVRDVDGTYGAMLDAIAEAWNERDKVAGKRAWDRSTVARELARLAVESIKV